jgi:hypothetical protein
MGPLDPHGFHPVYSIDAKSIVAIFPFNENGGPPTAPPRESTDPKLLSGALGVPLGHLAGSKPNLNFCLKNRLAVISSSC